MIRLILNVIWFIWGGWLAGLLWALGGCVLAISIIGLPFAPACFRIAGFSLWPFGRDIATRPYGLGTGAGGCLLNVIWFVFAGWYVALCHLVLAFTQAITIIGIPFAYKNVQLALLAVNPIGKDVVHVR
jgi:uncharacterized membrane protein YccF (DUF307 family)